MEEELLKELEDLYDTNFKLIGISDDRLSVGELVMLGALIEMMKERKQKEQ